MEQALKIATTVNHAEIQERRDETFYVDKARASGIQTDLHADSDAVATRETWFNMPGLVTHRLRTERGFPLEIRKTMMTWNVSNAVVCGILQENVRPAKAVWTIVNPLVLEAESRPMDLQQALLRKQQGAHMDG
jgi:hypothetical protein